MASPAGRGAQVRLDGDAQKAARGGLGGTLIATLEAKRLLEYTGAASDGATLDGSTRTGVAAEDEVLAPGGVLVGGGGAAISFGSTAGTAAQGNDPRITGALSSVDAAATYAPKASPAFSGAPTAPTPIAGDLSLQVSNTLWVRREIAALINSAPETLDTLGELATALANNPDFATTVATSLAQQAARITTLEGQVAALQSGASAGGAAAVTFQDGTGLTFQDGQPVVYQ